MFNRLLTGTILQNLGDKCRKRRIKILFRDNQRPFTLAVFVL
jgi:hypothetical protein